jgi:hypothetical protein
MPFSPLVDAAVFGFDTVSFFDRDFLAGAFSDNDLATSGWIYKLGGSSQTFCRGFGFLFRIHCRLGLF